MFVNPYFSIVRTVFARPRYSFGLTETSSHGNLWLVFGPPKEFLQANWDICAQQHTICLGPPKEFVWASRVILAQRLLLQQRTPGLCCHFLWANRDIFAWKHTACLSPPKELIWIKCRTPSSPPLGQPRHLCMALRTCLGPPKEFIAPREGSHHQSHRANHEVFTSQHVNSYGPPKDTTEATSKIHLSLTNWLLVTFTYFQYSSVYRFMTGIRASLLKGPRSHSSSNSMITSF
jgi:hypothetical protein